MRVGQACEAKWREASAHALEARFAAMRGAKEIRTLWKRAKDIPVKERGAWHSSEAFEDHVGDLEAWLHERVGTKVDAVSGEFPRAAPRIVGLSAKPPKGTRQRIIDEVAKELALAKKSVDNLWQAYRRFERDLHNPDGT